MLGLVKKVFKNKKSTEPISGDSKLSSFKKGSCSDCCGCGGCDDGCGGCGCCDSGCCGCC